MHLGGGVQGLDGTAGSRQLGIAAPCTDVITLRQLKVTPRTQHLQDSSCRLGFRACVGLCWYCTKNPPESYSRFNDCNPPT